jgi:hypothetical protein
MLRFFHYSGGLSKICREKVRILGCERAYARSHPKIRVSTTEIPKEPSGGFHLIRAGLIK